MDNIVLVFHFLIAVALIGLILLQQGKGAEAGASFGAGASQTMFGGSGSWNFFSRTTAILATIFFVTSISLAVISKNRTAVDVDLLPELEAVQVEQLQESELPAVAEEIESDAAELPEVPVESEIPQE